MRLFLKYFVSTDHKVSGLLYAFTSLFFLLVGFALVIIIRWQLAYPGEPLPLVGSLLGAANAPGGIVLPEFY
jgi:cytochrome c oxidase subunit 1